MEAGEGSAGVVGLGGADEEGKASGGGDEAGGDGEDGLEALDGAEGDDGEGSGGEGFGADVLYIDIRQCKGAGEFAEEGDFFVVGLDEGERDVRGPELDGDAGKSGAGAEVGDFKSFQRRGRGGRRGRPGKQDSGGEEGLAEVAGNDLFFIADGGEVEAGVPAEK